MNPAMHQLIEALRQFAAERDWDRYHSPKNLAMALSVEVAELVEPFQWLTQNQSRCLPPEKRRLVRDEIGDVLIYLIMLADKLEIDPLEAAFDKLGKNRRSYPADRVRGKTVKYSDY
ncbi:MAG TPA: nucleotide pyrophosphohydrolase [Desulfobacterales bacterium]